MRSGTIARARPAAMTPRVSSVRAHSSRTVGCSEILRYISGCVNAGSSPSLWP